MDYSLKLALVEVLYRAILGRGVNNQAEADQWARQIGDKGENTWQIAQAIAHSSEAQQGPPGGHALGILGLLQTKVGVP